MQHVHAQRENEERELEVADVDRCMPLTRWFTAPAHQLEAGDRQESHDGQRASVSNFPWPYG